MYTILIARSSALQHSTLLVENFDHIIEQQFEPLLDHFSAYCGYIIGSISSLLLFSIISISSLFQRRLRQDAMMSSCALASRHLVWFPNLMIWEPNQLAKCVNTCYFALFDGWVSSTDRQPKSIFASNKETDTNRSKQATVRVR